MTTREVFYPWSAQEMIDPVRISGGSGSWFWDDQGNRWLDLHAQLANLNLGHQHPAMVAAIQEQAARMCTAAPSFAVDVRDHAARMITDLAPDDLNTVFFTNGGADANEHAIRMARLVTGRHKVFAAHRSYHGGSDGAIGLSGDPRRWEADQRSAGVVRFFGPYAYRSEFHADSAEQECERALRHLRHLLQYEGPQTVAAILVEPVVGSNGVLVPPEGYLHGVRELCDEHGIMLVADEVITGFGRCGAWFGVDLWDVVPDLLTFAKGVNSGYVPVGGVLLSERVAGHFARRAYPGGLTYSGHPLACASIVASLETLRRDGLVERARLLGEKLVRPALQELARRHPSVGEIRGVGLAWAVELVWDQATREPFAPYAAPGPLAPQMAEVLAACKAEGVWPLAAANRLHLFPPLVIGEDELRQGIDGIDRALEMADKAVAARREKGHAQ